jgi:hypothetical protein
LSTDFKIQVKKVYPYATLRWYGWPEAGPAYAYILSNQIPLLFTEDDIDNVIKLTDTIYYPEGVLLDNNSNLWEIAWKNIQGNMVKRLESND